MFYSDIVGRFLDLRIKPKVGCWVYELSLRSAAFLSFLSIPHNSDIMGRFLDIREGKGREHYQPQEQHLVSYATVADAPQTWYVSTAWYVPFAFVTLNTPSVPPNLPSTETTHAPSIYTFGPLQHGR